MAKQALKHDSDTPIMHVDIETLKQCGVDFQSMILAATKVPENPTLEQRLMIALCSDLSQVVGASPTNRLNMIKPTIVE